MKYSSCSSVRPKLLQSCPTLCDPMGCTVHQTPLFMGFSRQEYWSEFSYPLPGDLPNEGIEPALLMSPALGGRFFTTSATWEAQFLLLAFLNPVLRAHTNTDMSTSLIFIPSAGLHCPFQNPHLASWTAHFSRTCPGLGTRTPFPHFPIRFLLSLIFH